MFGPKEAAGLTPKVANIIPGSPIAFEGMPTDGLLAGIVCLSPTLAGSLRNAIVAHVAESLSREIGVCFSLNLNKSTSYLSLFFSLNFFQ